MQNIVFIGIPPKYVEKIERFHDYLIVFKFIIVSLQSSIYGAITMRVRHINTIKWVGYCPKKELPYALIISPKQPLPNAAIILFNFLL